MALFSVTRFFGDDGEFVQDRLPAAAILEKLHAEAETRKQSSPLEGKKNKRTSKNVNLVSADSGESSTKKKKLNLPDSKTVKTGAEENESGQDGDETANDSCRVEKETINYSSPVKKKNFTVKNRKDSKSIKTGAEKNESEQDGDETADDSSSVEKKTNSSSLVKKKKFTDKNRKDDAAKLTPRQTSQQSELKESDELPAINTECEDVDVEENIDDDPVNEEELGRVSQEGPHNVGGFTVLGNFKAKHVEKAHRVLPDWLSRPDIIVTDLTHQQLPVQQMDRLDPDLQQKLLNNGITHFFPVQIQVIPALLDQSPKGYCIGTAGYRPRDVCVSAPTGSGKTLAFVLPIIQSLKSRVVPQLRALAVLPVQDLAKQVYQVFKTYCQGTGLKVGLLIGQKTFSTEQLTLVKRRLRGYQSTVDIIVATPGRLVDHINRTEGFDLQYLRYLVIDEADRMMEEINQDWLLQVESALYRTSSTGLTHRSKPGCLTVTSASKMQIPLQKLLFSATLSQNPETLQQLNLFQPRLFTSVVRKSKRKVENETDLNHVRDYPADVNKESTDVKREDDLPATEGEFIGKYTTPAELTEYCVECEASVKPLIILHMLHTLKFRQILCFANSVDTTHKLFLLIKLFGGITVQEFSSSLHADKRNRILRQFASGKIDIIICSDAMARGMDIENVKYVISYEPPRFIKTYIHRIGRTARAGKAGTAVTLLQNKEFYHFKKMVREAGKSGMKDLKIAKSALKPLVPTFQETLTELPNILEAEKKKRKSVG